MTPRLEDISILCPQVYAKGLYFKIAYVCILISAMKSENEGAINVP